jgi:hypothetical protein
LKNPGVGLTADLRTDTLVEFSWRTIEAAPNGMSRFLVAKLMDVDPKNRHDDFYAWLEITDDEDGRHNKDFDGAELGTERVVQIYLVDATCAKKLRMGDADTPHSKALCNYGGTGHPDSDGFKITVSKK